MYMANTIKTTVKVVVCQLVDKLVSQTETEAVELILTHDITPKEAMFAAGCNYSSESKMYGRVRARANRLKNKRSHERKDLKLKNAARTIHRREKKKRSLQRVFCSHLVGILRVTGHEQNTARKIFLLLTARRRRKGAVYKADRLACFFDSRAHMTRWPSRKVDRART